MATRTSHPGRTLIIFLLVIVGMFAWCAAIGEWKPKLGLDLQGGQRITLKASTTTGGGITKEKLDEAAGIISQRVNGVGVAESEVSTQGSNIIVVEVPGKAKEGLADTIGSTAQLRFRLAVAGGCRPPAPRPPRRTTDPDRSRPPPVTRTRSRRRAASRAATTRPSGGADRQARRHHRQEPARCRVAGEDAEGSRSHHDRTGRRGSDRRCRIGAIPPAPRQTGGVPPALVPPQLEPEIKDPLAWVQAPPEVWQQRLATFDCDKRNTAAAWPGRSAGPAAARLRRGRQPLPARPDDGRRHRRHRRELRHPAERPSPATTRSTSSSTARGRRTSPTSPAAIAGMTNPNRPGRPAAGDRARRRDAVQPQQPGGHHRRPCRDHRQLHRERGQAISPTRSSTARCRWRSRSRPSPTKVPSSPPTSSRPASSPASSVCCW